MRVLGMQDMNQNNNNGDEKQNSKPQVKLYESFSFETIKKKTYSEFSQFIKNDPLNIGYQSFKAQMGLKMNNYQTQYKVLTPIPNQNYQDYIKKIYMHKKMQRFLQFNQSNSQNGNSVIGLLNQSEKILEQEYRRIRSLTDKRIKPIDNNSEFIIRKKVVGRPFKVQQQEKPNSKEQKIEVESQIISKLKEKGICQWRDKLDVSINMDIAQMIGALQRFFGSLNSLEIEPENPEIQLKQNDQYLLKLSVDRALKWLVDKIIEAKLNPIEITLNASGDANTDIIKAFQDSRCMSNPKTLLQVKNNALDRYYLKTKVRFNSIQLGFQAKAYTNKIKDNQHFVPIRCFVGSSLWTTAKDQKKKNSVTGKQISDIDLNVPMCPFYLEYVREIDEFGHGKSPFSLHRFEMIHSHPLTLEYERIMYH